MRGDKGKLYQQILEDFMSLCATGNQPSSFEAYHKSLGVSKTKMRSYMKDRHINLTNLIGYKRMKVPNPKKEPVVIPFEQVIFEEVGFLPAEDRNVITVCVDGHVAVRFPADTDVSVIAKFVEKIRKEANHVGA